MRLIVFLCALFLVLNGKRVNQKIRLNQVKKWRYITKFGCELGQSEYNIKLSLVDYPQDQQTTAPIKFHLYLDEEWDDVLRLPECERHTKAKLTETLFVPSQGDPVSFTGTLNQKARRHMWYFVLEDCNQDFLNSVGTKNFKTRLQVDFHITNTDRSEFTTEDNGIGTLLGFLSIVNFLLLVLTLREIQREYKVNDEWDVTLIFIFIAMSIESLHHVCNLLHFQMYAGDGVGIPAFSTVADILEVKVSFIQITAAFIVTLILIMLASGWSIEFKSLLKFDVLIPLGMVVGMGQMMIVGLAKLTDDHHTKYHKYEGWQGYTITVLYLLQYAYFIGNIILTQFQSESVKRFMVQLSIYGSLYFLSFPIFFIVVHFTAPYVRQKIIVYGTSLIRLIAMAFLMRMFSSKKSTYYQISYKNKSILDRSKFE